jgi:hypothetical protein
MNRAARRAGLSDQRGALMAAKAEQAARRRSGDWPAWERHAVPPGAVGGGSWLGAIHSAFANGVYSVLVRTVETEWGPVEHAAISTLSGGDIPWSAKQRIKAELFGTDRTAVEVFPAEADLIDQADMYHFFVMPAGFRLPFTIKPGGGA